ncbi:MAG: hypothetical protein GWP47_04145 [Actinobacteria bacterium]|nr:hypothetical protein [Actinomycetota bacterium]NCG39269.1 hypothetical protein [Actinomycetota bacterium]
MGGHKPLDPFGLSTDRPVAMLRDTIVTARAVFAAESAPGYEPAWHAIGRRDVPIWVTTRGLQVV